MSLWHRYISAQRWCFEFKLSCLWSTATHEIIRGITEVLEKSIMVAFDHYCQVILRKTSAPWGSFRTPRRERLISWNCHREHVVLIGWCHACLHRIVPISSCLPAKSILCKIPSIFCHPLSEHGRHGCLAEKMVRTSTCINCHQSSP